MRQASSTDDLHARATTCASCFCSQTVPVRHSALAQTNCAVTAQRIVSPRAQFLRSQGLRSWAQLPSHFPTSPTMHAVERLRRLPTLPTHLRPFAIRTVEPLRRAEVFGTVVHVRSLILLLVAHDAFPFPSPSKNISEVARAAPAHTDRATRSALLSVCSLSDLHAGKRVAFVIAPQYKRL
jgi:hypothetical protein